MHKFCITYPVVVVLLLTLINPGHSNVSGDTTDIPISMSVEATLRGWFGDFATDGQYLFSLHNLGTDSDTLKVYDVTDPVEPHLLHTYDHENTSAIFVSEHVFLANDSGLVSVYGVDAGGALHHRSDYQSVDEITDMVFYNTHAYVLPYQYPEDQQSTRLEIVNLTESPYLKSSIRIPGRAKALSPVFAQHYIAAAYTAGGTNNGLIIIDVSDPAAPVAVDTLTTTLDPIDIGIDGDMLLLALNGTDHPQAVLELYDISTPEMPQHISTQIIDDDGYMSDLMTLDGTIFVSLSSARQVTSWVWHSETDSLKAGPAVETAFPMQMIALSEDREHLYKSTSEHTPTDDVTYYLYSGEQSEGVRIIKIVKRKPKENDVFLIVSIEPGQAASDGCTTTPPPSTYFFDPENQQTVELEATPITGWEFSHWTGPVPNTNPTTITMTEDAVVTAVFQPILTITGRQERRLVCPHAGLESDQLITPINLVASQADDWTAVTIKLKASGSGHEVRDIEKVLLKQGNSVAASGKFSQDDGEITLNFEPPLVIPQASAIHLGLYYRFNYDFSYWDSVHTFARDSVRTFLIETQDLTAIPHHYLPGQILGSAANDTLMIARVKNSAGRGFAKIQQALDHASTKTGDTVWVCPGLYQEPLNINRALCLKAVSTEKPVILTHNQTSRGYTLPLIDISAESGSVSIIGFTFRGGTKSQAAIYSYNLKNSLLYLTNNTFENELDAVHITEGQSICIDDNVFGYPECCSIYINYTPSVTIENNFFKTHIDIAHVPDVLSELVVSTINLKNVYNKVVISDNRSETDFGIKCYKIANASISGNSVNQTILWGGFLSVDQSKGIKITDNTNFRILFRKSSFGSIKRNSVYWQKRYNQDLPMIHIEDAFNLDIKNNSLTESEEHTNHGIRIMRGADFIDIHHNKISAFKQGISGWESSSVRNLTRGNKILDNRILNCAKGIFFISSKYWYISGNVLLNNETAINLQGCTDIRILLNIIRNSTGLFTGIHSDHSFGWINNNHLVDNVGSGIALKNGSSFNIHNNNIYDNDTGVSSVQTDTITADDNWWGSTAGPLDDDLSGSVKVNRWLQEPVNFVLAIPQDTLYLHSDLQDSAAVLCNRFDGQADQIHLFIDDATGWLSFAADTLNLSDSSAALSWLKFNGRQTGESGMVRINAESERDGLLASDSMYVSRYVPAPAHISITPDSVTLAPGDSVQFDASCFDQVGHRVDAAWVWTAQGGFIDSTGLYTAGETEGEFLITVSVDNGAVQQTAVVVIDAQAAVRTPESIPEAFRLYSAFPNPFNPVTTLRFETPEPVEVKIRIFNIRGQVIWFMQKHMTPGQHDVRWNGRDEAGRPVSSGLYLMELRAGKFRAVQKLLLVQ